MNFQLHVDSKLGVPEIGKNYFLYPALDSIKVNPGDVIRIETGVKVESCNSNGNIHVNIADNYKDKLVTRDNVFDPYYTKNIIVTIWNKTFESVSIPNDSYLFKYEWVSTDGTDNSDNTDDTNGTDTDTGNSDDTNGTDNSDNTNGTDNSGTDTGDSGNAGTDTDNSGNAGTDTDNSGNAGSKKITIPKVKKLKKKN